MPPSRVRPPFDAEGVLIHVIEETARHAGHMDTIRELLDGAKSYY